MARIWTDILLPAAIAGAVAAQTLGVEIHRASRLHAWFPQAARDTVQVDTVKIRPDSLKNKQDSLKARLDSLAQVPDSLAQIPDSLLQVPDSLLRSPLDSLAEEEDFDLFYTSEEQDTVPSITARDTMKVPDSLRLTDPFLYQWYVATKDSYIHKLVVDSLKAEGDSLIWPRVDSLYLADSTYKAKLAWEKKWAGMSKAERKRWTYENVQLPAILHKQDSIRKIRTVSSTPSARSRTVSSTSKTASGTTPPASWKPPSSRIRYTSNAISPGATTASTTGWKPSSGTPPPTTISRTIPSCGER